MSRASKSLGAGRIPTGFTPPSTAISNRHWMRLEIAVTPSKQTPDSFLIDTENALFRAARRNWGSQFSLRTEARPSLKRARTTPSRSVAQAAVGLCAFAVAVAIASASALPPLTSSRLPLSEPKGGPFTGRRISLRFCSRLVHHPTTHSAPVTAGQRSALTRQPLPACLAPVATQLTISNRSARRLEMPESYTKQRTDPLSNRHKFIQSNCACSPASSRQRREIFTRQSPRLLNSPLMSRQKMGQHFLGDAGWRKRILEALNPKPNETWVEIGPGHGEITRHLTGDGRRVIAIEADTALATALNSEIEARPDEWRGVEIVTSDVLKADIGSIIGPRFGDATKTFRVYGSLPYYITSPILHHLFQWADRIDSIHIVIQLEVAERIAAKPGSRDYGYLSVASQFYTHPAIALKIPPGAFRPPPKVDSALVAMSLPGERASLSITDEAGFLKFVQACFAQKRKTLRNNLLALAPDETVRKVIADAGLPSDVRAEGLFLPQFAVFWRQLLEG